MSILLRSTAFAVLAMTVPVIGGSGVEDWTTIGRLRGLDETESHVIVATRVEGDFDARLDTLPELDEEVAPAPRRVGVGAMHLIYDYDCATGEIADVVFNLAYDTEGRRMTAPPDFVDLVVRSHRTGLAAASTDESRAGWRKICARLGARDGALRS